MRKIFCWFFLAFFPIIQADAALVARAAELPTIEVGLPEDGLFGLGGQYLIDKAIDRNMGSSSSHAGRELRTWNGCSHWRNPARSGYFGVGGVSQSQPNRDSLDSALSDAAQLHPRAQRYAVQNFKGSPGQALCRAARGHLGLQQLRLHDEEQGVDIEKFFQLKKLGAAGISTTLERGEVEAGYSWEAHVSKLLATDRYRVLLTPREELNRLLKTKVKTLGWIGALDSWTSKNQPLITRVRAAWQEIIGGVQNDEAHFRKHAKRFFGLEKPEELELGWSRTRVFLLPPDFAWPDQTNLEIEKRYLKESVELGIFPKTGAGVIDALFVP
jgi:hypothetical protein